MTDSAEKTTTASKERRRWLDIRREVYKKGYAIGYEKFLAEGEPVRIADWRAQDFAKGYVKGYMEGKAAYRRYLQVRLILLLAWPNEAIARLFNEVWDEGPALTATGIAKRRLRLANCLCNPHRAAVLARYMEKSF